MWIFTIIKGNNYNREATEHIHNKAEALDFYRRWRDRVVKVQLMQYKDVTEEFKNEIPG